MFVQVDLSETPPVVTLEEPADTSRFHVEVRCAGIPAPDRLGLVYGALVDAAAGRLEGDAAWISVDAVRRLASGRVASAWDDELEAMLDYARGKGWLDEPGHAIRAHVEWSE